MARDMRVCRNPMHPQCRFPGHGNHVEPAISDSLNEIIPSVVYIEACETYQKQSYRNRCHFYADNGMQTLSFPIVHVDGSHNNIPIKEVLVDYSTDWVTRHERAITSAYRTSAYFDYYCDELFAILDSHPERLFDLNMRILEFFIGKLGLAVELSETEEFYPCGSEIRYDDYRGKIHPKRKNSILAELNMEKPYFQVFSGKYGFIPNLSIMDLLFNEGPDSIRYVKAL